MPKALDANPPLALCVNRSDALPLWCQVRLQLIEKIISRLEPGDRIPSEAELCARFGVSRAVVRQAIGSLVADRVLFRRQGLGTFVAPRCVEHDILKLDYFTQTLRESGLSTETELIRLSEEVPGPKVKNQLYVSDRDLVFKIERRILLENEPIGVQFDWIPKRYCPSFLSDHIDFQRIGPSMARMYGLHPRSMDISIGVKLAGNAISRQLGIKPSAPVLVVHRIFRLSSGEPFRYTETSYRHDRFTLTMKGLVVTE